VKNTLLKGTREYELDALRGIAALLVVLFHYSQWSDFDLRFLHIGSTGVDLFFLISGYVIFMTLNKTATSGEFIISRLSRLFPSYLTMITLTLLTIKILAPGVFPDIQEILGNLTMLQPFFRVPNIDDVYWTLTVELEFYILLLILFKLNWLNRILYIGFFLVLIFQAYHYIALAYFSNSPLYIIPRSLFPIISHFQLFFAGILFYKVKTEGYSTIIYAMLLLCFLASIPLFIDSGKAHYFISLPEYVTMLALYFLIFYLFVNRKLASIAISPLLFLGNISYCLYLIHLKAGMLMHQYLVQTCGLNKEIALLILLAIMIIVSYIVTFFIERPLITFIRRRFLDNSSSIQFQKLKS
jgi:peptidoglycan/LPS O-acetylase OafA/YrhL